mmetsp:Transcript_67708/g.196090  ORF Transcript_67708/g.196090 Transcript_67708/m.196090 type:complete len:228 (+) Transcript_67708:1018-1701(+)
MSASTSCPWRPSAGSARRSSPKYCAPRTVIGTTSSLPRRTPCGSCKWWPGSPARSARASAASTTRPSCGVRWPSASRPSPRGSCSSTSGRARAGSLRPSGAPTSASPTASAACCASIARSSNACRWPTWTPISKRPTHGTSSTWTPRTSACAGPRCGPASPASCVRRASPSRPCQRFQLGRWRGSTNAWRRMSGTFDCSRSFSAAPSTARPSRRTAGRACPRRSRRP